MCWALRPMSDKAFVPSFWTDQRTLDVSLRRGPSLAGPLHLFAVLLFSHVPTAHDSVELKRDAQHGHVVTGWVHRNRTALSRHLHLHTSCKLTRDPEAF